MSTTPNIPLEINPTNSLLPGVVANSNLQVIDALLPLAVQSATLSDPPATTGADVGKRWIVASSPTGAWSGAPVGSIALCTAEDAWLIIPPVAGLVGRNLATSGWIGYTGSAWESL